MTVYICTEHNWYDATSGCPHHVHLAPGEQAPVEVDPTEAERQRWLDAIDTKVAELVRRRHGGFMPINDSKIDILLWLRQECTQDI